jgi:CRP-like cAMP-binding protein
VGVGRGARPESAGDAPGPGPHPVHPDSSEPQVLFLLLRGRVRLYKSVEGWEIILGVVGAGEMFGEAAFTSRRQGSYAHAMEPSEVALMNRETFCSLVRDRPEVALCGARHYCTPVRPSRTRFAFSGTYTST